MPRRKSKTTNNLSNNQSLTAITTPVAPVALLIDGENFMAAELITNILVEAGKLGGVRTCRVYGNWGAPSMQRWEKYMDFYKLERIGNRSGHNATDIALVIGAMDLLHQGLRHFCLVTGDSDYVPLVERLHQDGCTVLVIGTKAASKDLKEVSSTFLSTEELVPSKLPASPSHASPLPSQLAPTKVAASSKKQSAASPISTSLHSAECSTLLIKAYQIAAQKKNTEWVLLAALGQALKQLNPDFGKVCGNQKLATLVNDSSLFETRPRKTSKNTHTEIRLQQNDFAPAPALSSIEDN